MELLARIDQLLGKDFSKQDNLYYQVNYLASSTKCFSTPPPPPALFFLAGRQPEFPTKYSVPNFLIIFLPAHLRAHFTAHSLFHTLLR